MKSILRNRLIHLHRCRHITRRIIHKILRIDPTLHHIYSLSTTAISDYFSLPIEKASTVYTDLHSEHLWLQIQRDLTRYHIITIVDDNYPRMLKPIHDPPIVLYGLGKLNLLHSSPLISVIGTRTPSREARGKTDFIVKSLVEHDWVIVSGMAKGIDSFAHQLCLQYAGQTIAVLGGGFHHIYPKQHQSLFKQIAKYGLVLSEYSPNQKPRPYHFPERNRIISGLSFGTVVIEAMEKSGTLITVDQALDQGREVYALPGSPLIPQAKGCNQMIQEGAKLVQHANDILEDWEGIRLHQYS
ncbi:MAG TPA: DNA-processing protein DprA [Bacillota bacterium]